MTVVLDANILLRLADVAAGQHATAVAAVDTLAARGDTPVVFPQAVYEFWVVATRPLDRNGLGLAVPVCNQRIDQFLARFPMLVDPPGLFGAWRALVAAHGCRGKIAHDARYVAALQVHNLTHLLTFNVADFACFPGLVVLDPAAVAAGHP